MAESIAGKANTINDWASEVRKIDPKFATQIDVERRVRDDGIERLNLPRYRKETQPLTSFLQDPVRGFHSIGTPQFYINLSPTEEGRDNGLQRKRAYNLTEEQVLQYINDNIPKGEEGKFSFTLSEYFKNELSGNIVVNPDGRVFLEAAEGEHLPIAIGTKTPDYILKRDEFTHVFQIFHRTKEGEEERLRDERVANALLSTLQAIPHEGFGKNVKFTPGYYEFTCVKRAEDKPLEPIFIEYQDNPAYYLP
ncbi:MAG TPA: hypothetical protein VNW29_00210 [Candidatus Sulfotelmatobacter sp.]|jgi:hypothetical protein|nr:hypothetical protein [Candidatus Sulfotelmatobacter sp.]